jgi:hypothetical protein
MPLQGNAAVSLDRPRPQRAIGVIYRPEIERLSHYFAAQRRSGQFSESANPKRGGIQSICLNKFGAPEVGAKPGAATIASSSQRRGARLRPYAADTATNVT